MMQRILDFLSELFNIILTPLSKNLRYLIEKSDSITFRDLIFDFTKVLLSVGMPLLFTFAGIFVFTILPQGKDVLLIVIEDITNGLPASSIWLIFGICFWSIVSEFASRYAVYVTDNSARSISGERVEWRKELQKFISSLFLLFPFAIVSFRLLFQYLNKAESEKEYPYWILFGLLYLTFYLVSYIYLAEEDNPKNPFNRLGNWLRKRLNLDLTKEENEWAGRLFGIYNTYVFTLPAHTLFKEASKYSVTKTEPGPEFPLSNDINFPPGKRIYPEFRLLTYGLSKDNPYVYEWTYFIPNTFFNKLHKQLWFVSLISLVSFFLIALLPVSAYENIGAPALVCIAFGCWLGLYSTILYIDCALLRYPSRIDSFSSFKPNGVRRAFSKVSFRFGLIVIILTFSYLNNDHPILANAAGTSEIRPTLKEHFTDWKIKFQAEQDSSNRKKSVFFICAEGGPLRTGAFTALFLARLQDSIISLRDSTVILQDSVMNRTSSDLKNHIYAFSGVSGGSLGLSLYNAIAYLTPSQDLKTFPKKLNKKQKAQNLFTNRTEAFFKGDFLSPVIGKMFFSELINLLWPQNITEFNRAVALEESWENKYASLLISGSSNNVFSFDFNRNYIKNLVGERYPAFFINTTEVESGRQSWVANVIPSALMQYRERDLLFRKINHGINYSAAVNFSSRFPLFSPGGMVSIGGEEKYHYVDGGYFENSGASTMLEILQYLKKENLLQNITPYVLLFRFSDDESLKRYSNVNFVNEITEVIYGIYNTRSGHTYKSVYELKEFIKNSLGNESARCIEFSLPANASEVPMNWVLSNQAVNNLNQSINQIFKSKAKEINMVIDAVK
jgi:hypothetical protein